MRTTIKELLTDYKKLLHHDITVQGWVRAFRSNRFIALNDGSTINNIQIVVDFENFDDGYIVKGSVGSTPEITSTLFSKPNMPVSIGSTGTKFLILTRENKVYSSLDGYTFSYDGIADIGFSLINERQIFLQYHNDRWFFSSSGNLYFTENITALSGWTKSNLSSSQIIPGDNIFANYDSTMFAMCIRRVGFSSNSVILKSIDYGVNWIAIKDLTENQLYANIFNIGGILISVKYGYFRKTIISYDGGTSWNDYTNDLIECDVKSQYHVQFGNKLSKYKIPLSRRLTSFITAFIPPARLISSI